MQHDRKADIADLLWHGFADALPAPLRAIQAVDAAVILLVEPLGSARMLHHAMRIVTERHARVGQEVRRTAFVERGPVAAGVGGLEHAADRDRDVQVPRVARVHENGVQELPVRRAERRPLRAHRMVVEPGHRFPVLAAVRGAKQSRRGTAGVPGRPLGMVAGREPEDALHGACFLAVVDLAKSGRSRGLAPTAAAIGRAEHGRPEMPGLGRQQQHPWLARILYYVVNDVAEKLRACEFPVAARAIGAQREQTLTRSDPQRASHDEEDPRPGAALSTPPRRRAVRPGRLRDAGRRAGRCCAVRAARRGYGRAVLRRYRADR